MQAINATTTGSRSAAGTLTIKATTTGDDEDRPPEQRKLGLPGQPEPRRQPLQLAGADDLSGHHSAHVIPR